MWRAHIENGRVVLPARLIEWARVHNGAHLSLEHVKAERSPSQLRMYRAWLHKVADETGNDEEELHEFLLDRCAPRVVVTIKGPRKSLDIERVKRTSGNHSLSMNKTEMEYFMDRCAALTGVALPTEEELEAMGYAKGRRKGKKVDYPSEEGNIPTQF